MSKQLDEKLEKLSPDELKLWKMRHTAEHLLHQAVKELYPSIQLAMGPATEDGFYFDFDASPEGAEPVKLSEEDFPKIEKRIKFLAKRNLPMIRKEVSPDEARELFAGNPYKQEWVDLAESRGEKVSLYWTGNPGEKDSMVDLCAGPHAEKTGEVKAVKLLSVAGAYWHGDEKNKMLTRVYGTAFFSQEELNEYLRLQEEAKARDHKKLGKELDLFTFSDLVGAGLPLWTPKGTQMRFLLDEYLWELRSARGFDRVEIPHIAKKDLYQTSGHWDKFKDELFHIKTREGHDFVMKPMNCPHHTQIFARKQFSYREMPQRYANTTMVYRDEQSGELSGLSRVRSITQDDSHVFCRNNQIKEEVNKLWDIIDGFYGIHGFDMHVRLSLSDPAEPEKYLGGAEVWNSAEQQLRELAQERGVAVVEAPGEAAFYGPKLDFMSYDSIKREWQLSTIQLDFVQPERFDLSCINEDGEKERVVMLHFAVMGSIERFTSILVEHYAGKFPTWLAPVQVKVLPVSEKFSEYAEEVRAALAAAGVRVELDDRAERLPARIRDAQLEKVPYMLVVGAKEAEDTTVTVRHRDKREQEVCALSEFVTQLSQEIAQRS